MVENKKLIVVVGPTAVGKTDMAIRLAKELKTEIISADARQFYKEMDIGTAKPSADELRQAKHHFINNLSITDEYSAGKFETEAIKVIEEIHKQNQYAILVGGSGLFVKAVCEGFDEMPDINPEIRINLQKQFESEGIESLLSQLKNLDKTYYEMVDKNNVQRVMRGLEICLGTGKPFSSFRKATKAKRNFEIIKIGLNTERSLLYEKIDLRVEKMLEQGLENEVRQLLPYKHLNALQTVGYSEMFEYFEQNISFEEAVRLIKRNSRHYAKRQLTWFQKDTEIKWFNPKDWKNVLAYIRL